jgi:hypothetical protein
MSADIRRFLKRSSRRPSVLEPTVRSVASGGRADLRKLFAFVDRWAARNRIDEKLKRLEKLDPASFGSVAPRIEAIVDDALAAVPARDQCLREQSKPPLRLTWAIVALMIVVVLIAIGQYLATVIRL